MSSRLSFATDLAYLAGDIIKKNFTLGMKKEWKTDDSPVTETDKTINQLVLRSVRKRYPDHDVLAEEGSDIKHRSDYVWVCDPVDGTIPFSHGVPTCVFSLALVKDGVPIVAVVYDPFMDRLFTAEKGKGAKLNKERIAVSSAKTLKNQVVGLNIWHHAPYNVSAAIIQLDKEGELIPINLESIAYQGVLVACGEMVATIYDFSMAHDIAALKLIVEEAGGKVTDLFGNEQRYDRKIKGAVISNGKVHNLLIQKTQSCLATASHENKQKRQREKEQAVLFALQKDMALIRRGLSIYGMKRNKTLVKISKSKSYGKLWCDALVVLKV